MKYPQLVSARAVNAISDWLVSRLEQLGVEAPHIYTRLLLSLLQTSVHINDPIEFSSLETFIVNRKGAGGGSIRRYLQLDANTLKKLNAIQCLSEIVSPDQELTSIESLVDELWEKLKDFEKQNDRYGDVADVDANANETSILIDASINKTKSNTSVQQEAAGTVVGSPKPTAFFSKNFKNDKPPTTIVVAENNAAAKKGNFETESDPKKRYYNAFPALSKEMEDSFRIWRQNAKSLTWPVNRCQNNLSSSTNKTTSKSAPNPIMSSNAFRTGSGVVSSNGEAPTNESFKNKELMAPTHFNNMKNHAIVTSTTSTLKRKTKRRKSQSMSKGRSMPNTRKSDIKYNDSFAVTSANQSGRRTNRHLSPTQWDTDFDGYWEMGRDLIKEFFAKQGDRNRNRCNSEGSVQQHQQQHEEEQDDENVEILKNMHEIEFDKHHKMINCNITAASGDTNISPQLMPPPQFDISFFYDENGDDEDTYKSISELTADSSLANTSRSSPRRLYQRLAMPETIDADYDDKFINSNINNNYGDKDKAEQEEEDQNDFMQYKSKFNSNIAALWQDVPIDDDGNENEEEELAVNNAKIMSTASLWSPPNDNVLWPSVEPMKENLQNFWSIFNNHPLDFAKMLQRQQEKQQYLCQQNNIAISQQLSNENATVASLPYELLATYSVQDDNANFISMPNNLNSESSAGNSNNCGVNNKRRHDGRNTPVGVFLQDTIWSENLNGGKNTDTDESFYLKVWNSNNKLYNLDAVYESKLAEASDDSKINSSSSSASFQYYGNSKWSEGINAGPATMLQQQREQHKLFNKEKNNGTLIEQQQQQQQLNNVNVNSVDCVDASMPTTASSSSCSYMLSSSGIFSGHRTPSLQSSQQSLQATNTTSDKMSSVGQEKLAEEYGMCSPGAAATSTTMISSVVDNDDEEQTQQATSLITLPNHSTESSGFTNYARIKSMAKSLGQDNIKQQQLNYKALLPMNKDQLPRYADDENLLTSERTHFQPIKAYADGYTFDVCSALDIINYRRSESGYLYYESHRYMEYTRNDNYMAEDDSNSGSGGNGLGVSAAPLYAGSNCEAAEGRKQPRNEELILKFRIMNCEMACQTDDEETVLRRMHVAAQMHPLYLIFSGASTDGVQIQTTGQACSNAIEALNKAVAAAEMAATERDRMCQMDRPWLGLHKIVSSSSRNSRDLGNQSRIWTRAQVPQRHEEIGGDEIDYCNESTSCAFSSGDGALMNETQWPNVGDVCLLPTATVACQEIATTMQTANNNTCTDLTAHTVGDLHTLWGVCAACSGNDFKEAPPANDLLRDELNLEADQIMSDLKNMQDLYIGASEGDNEHEQEWHSSDIRHPTAIVASKSSQITNSAGAWHIGSSDGIADDNSFEKMRQKATQQKVLQQVNKLIANLMRPERANDTNVLADAATSAHRELGESLWPDDGEHSIWKNRNEVCNEKNSSRQADLIENANNNNNNSGNNNNSVFSAEEKQFLAQLTWEHNNLAELWSKETPPPIATATPKTLTHTENVASSTTTMQEQQQQTPQAVYPTSKPMPNDDNQAKRNTDDCAATFAHYKRIQQFLNSTTVAHNNHNVAAKLKLSNRKRRHSASQNYASLSALGGGGSATFCTAAANIKNNNNNNKNHNNNNNDNNSNNNNNNNFKIVDFNNFNIKRNLKLSNAANVALLNSASACAAATAVFSTSEAEDVDMEHANFSEPSNFLITKNIHNVNAYKGICGGGGNDDALADEVDGIGVILPTPKQTIITCKYWATIDPLVDSVEDTIDCNEYDNGEGDGNATATFSCLLDKNDAILKHVAMLARPLTR